MTRTLNPFQMGEHLIRTEGASGLFRGLSAALLRQGTRLMRLTFTRQFSIQAHALLFMISSNQDFPVRHKLIYHFGKQCLWPLFQVWWEH